MPKAKVWTSEERRVAAIAYTRATHDCVHGKDQTGTDFWNRVEQLIMAIPTTEARNAETTRTAYAIKHFMNNNVFRDINKFGVSLNLVLSAKPSGVTDQEIINMAVAVHLNKATGRDYNQKDFDATRWLNYRAWQVLKTTRKFAPPSSKSAIELVPVAQSEVEEVIDNIEGAVESTNDATKIDAMTAMIFKPIGQKQAKRERFPGNIKGLMNEKNEELKRLRIAIDTRNKLVEHRQSNQERSQRISELKSLMKLTKGEEQDVYEKTRKMLVELISTPTRDASVHTYSGTKLCATTISTPIQNASIHTCSSTKSCATTTIASSNRRSTEEKNDEDDEGDEYDGGEVPVSIDVGIVDFGIVDNDTGVDDYDESEKENTNLRTNLNIPFNL